MTDSTIAAQLVAIARMPTAELRTLWKDYFSNRANPWAPVRDQPASATVPRSCLWRLKPTTRAKLDALADGADPKQARKRARRLIAGTRLCRVWQGVEHTVTVLHGGGFDWEGRRYASLSAVARAITGTRWNGPLFFGLRSGKT